MFLITYRLMHRQLLDMVEEPKIAETPSTEEGTFSGKLLILFYIIHALHCDLQMENRRNRPKI